jgi:hypothetical protein
MKENFEKAIICGYAYGTSPTQRNPVLSANGIRGIGKAVE